MPCGAAAGYARQVAESAELTAPEKLRPPADRRIISGTGKSAHTREDVPDMTHIRTRARAALTALGAAVGRLLTPADLTPYVIRLEAAAGRLEAAADHLAAALAVADVLAEIGGAM